MIDNKKAITMDAGKKYTLGAYFQAYRNKKATRFVLENFKKHFSTSPVFLISDGGEDLEDIAEEFQCGYVKLDNLYGDKTNFYPINFYNSTRMKEAWRRHKMAVDHCQTEYVIILEDDVYVKKGFDITEEFALRGARIGNGFSAETYEKVVLSGGTPSTYYGMCGGSIYNAKIFNSIYDDVLKDIDLEHDRLLLTGRHHVLGAIDASITYHFNKRGFKYENSPWMVETHERIEQEKFQIIHKYKDLYI
jgi:hypothetical protein